MIRVLLIPGRIVAVLFLLVVSLVTSLLLKFLPDHQFFVLISWWYRLVSHCLGLRSEFNTTPLLPGALMVVNHVSWLDIVLIGGHWPVVFLANAKVRSWPLIGWLAARTRSLFIKQGSGAEQATQEMASVLGQGQAIVLFPEGRVNKIGQPGRFQARLFQAAINIGAPIQPLAIEYLQDNGEYAGHVSYAGDINLINSFWLIVSGPKVVARFTLMPALGPCQSRQQLANKAEAMVKPMIVRSGEG